MKPALGRQLAEETRERIEDALRGAHMVFIAAGMGGGTGTGAAPVIAEVAKQMGILTVGVVTRPFAFEGRKRMEIANQGIQQLKERVDSLIIVPNEKLLQVLGKDMTVLNAFKQANNVLYGAVQGIADLILLEGLINVDFADMKSVLLDAGTALMGVGTGSGDGRAEKAPEFTPGQSARDDDDRVYPARCSIEIWRDTGRFRLGAGIQRPDALSGRSCGRHGQQGLPRLRKGNLIARRRHDMRQGRRER